MITSLILVYRSFKIYHHVNTYDSYFLRRRILSYQRFGLAQNMIDGLATAMNQLQNKSTKSPFPSTFYASFYTQPTLDVSPL
jgi:hypothetical protein